MRAHCSLVHGYLWPSCFVLLAAPFSWGQILNVTNDTSTPIPRVGHDYIGTLSETVNPANGSLSIRINVPMPRGRRLTLPLAFAYDTAGVHHAIDPGTGKGTAGWNSNSSFLSQGGWTYTVPLLSEVWGQKIGTDLYGNKYTCYFYTDYLLQDPQGGREALGIAVASDPTECALAINNKAYLPASGAGGFFAANVPSFAGPVRVVDTDGTVFQFATVGNHIVGSGNIALPTQIEDRNGNQLTVTDSNNGAFSVVDTLGRTAVSSSGFGSGVTNLTVSGLAPYSISWGTASSNFQVGWSDVGVNGIYCHGFPPDQESLPGVQTLTLPNGKSYQFSYDPTYGLLSQITYPNGGWVKYTWGFNSRSDYGTVLFIDSAGNSGTCYYQYDSPAITRRTVSFDGVSPALEQDFSYSTNWNGGGQTWASKQSTVVTKDLARGAAFTTTTAYTYTYFTPPPPPNEPLATFANEIPLEQTVVYKDSGGTTLRTINKTWAGPYELTREQVALENGLVSEKDFTYGLGGQITERDEYDYGSGARGPLLRKTAINYASFPPTPISSAGAACWCAARRPFPSNALCGATWRAPAGRTTRRRAPFAGFLSPQGCGNRTDCRSRSSRLRRKPRAATTRTFRSMKRGRAWADL